MLDTSERTSVLALHEKGLGVRAIARAMKLSRGAVRDVLRSQSADVPRPARAEKAQAFEEDIRALHERCKGNLVRVHEELLLKGATLSYQALTGFCRRHGIGVAPKKPAGRYVFEPGQEMQHDTSPHRVRIGGVERLVQTASVVLAYSRMRFLQLYPDFDRFTCKLFLDEAIHFFGGACRDCMVDNTHVIRLKGTGKDMVPAPEMEAFAQRFGFRFVAHAVGDANRSGHVERGFDHFERNFLAGREFDDFGHANHEARAWCEQVNGKQRRELHASALELFAKEQPHLLPLPAWVPEVYRLHHRVVDLEGFVHADGHIYSVPYQLIGHRVEVRETRDRVRVFDGPRQVAEHERLFCFEKRRVTDPSHRPPRGQGAALTRQPSPDERELLDAEPPLPDYAKQVKQRGSNRWPQALRRLAQMRRDYPRKPFLDAVKSATHYGLYDLDRLERMVLRNIATEYFVAPADRGARPEDEGHSDEG
ncbi:MAG: IS21 family transposase [Myxococcaceae bacterium]|nr:IS21 family transposase [Myxococcaceae bacterium]